METEKLNAWKELLLDTGKRNNLINFKDSKTSSAEILAPDFDEIFSVAAHAGKLEVYEPEQELYDDIFDDEEKENMSVATYLSAYAHRLGRRQLLIYNQSSKPLTALDNIRRKAAAALEETGINISYIAFGFIRWFENDDREHAMRAPILLAPVTIEHDSSVSPYYIKAIDDDIIVNPTFAFKLHSDYGIDLPEFDEDDDVSAFFDSVAELVSKLGWTVYRECRISVFSFQKLNMYKDLDDNASEIVKNINVQKIMGKEIDCQNEPPYSPPADPLVNLHNVVDADSSQAEAITLAKSGKSFVLQGPPGTGKSQTITNIIAECLYDGKKVLFVSEKLAALNVVYEKLKRAELNEFCLELHSHKANKRRIISELSDTLKTGKSGLSQKAEKELQIKQQSLEALNSYACELHKPREVIEKSLFCIYGEISSRRNAPDTGFVIKNIENKGETYYENAEKLLSGYADYTEYVGSDFRRNVWYGYADTNVSFESTAALKVDLKTAAALCRELTVISQELRGKYGIAVENLLQARACNEFLQLAAKESFAAPALLRPDAATLAYDAALKMRPLAADILSLNADIDEGYDSDIYKLDCRTMYKKITRRYSGFFSRLFGGEYKQIINELRLYRRNGKKPKYRDAADILRKLCDRADKTEKFNELYCSVPVASGPLYKGVNTDFEKLIAELTYLIDMHATGISFGKLAEMSESDFRAIKDAFAAFAARTAQAFTAVDAQERMRARFDAALYDVQKANISVLAEKYENCLSNIDKLDNWCGFTKLLRLLKDAELYDYVTGAIDKELAPEDIVPCFGKLFYTRWADAIIRSSPILTETSRVPHDRAVKTFKEKDTLDFEINKARIKAVLSAKRPSTDMVAAGSAVAVLLRESEKKRKQKGIRRLLSEIGELAQLLKPCFLMSPLSVSTFLSSDMQFDTVIFDEASQIFPQDAIGAIYRGKQLIVVGDSKQMPPANFFTAIAGSDDESEDDEAGSFESVLDICAASMPQLRLKWHYRSRTEQLIAFSNKNFYDNELITFPAPQSKRPGLGVDYIFTDGTFDRKSKNNRVEAEKIADLVFEHAEKHPGKSLGVVAFGISQQTLIERIISRRRRLDPSKEEFFKADKNEPFFVKNLETVQGDERDTVIFSVGYGRDTQGRLLLNFGPVNREGGERRLNVAVTRAKCHVILVSSMHYTDIDLSRVNSEGARLLREYLDYAENGNIALSRSVSVNKFNSYDSQFEIEVCEFLRANGYSVDTQVGCSSFKIDLAVKRPNSSDYLLAVECDGASYHSSKTARDRDRLRQEILERMGWKFYRVWSTDWFRNNTAEKEKLLEAAKEAVSAPAPEIRDNKNIAEQEIDFDVPLEEKNFSFPVYVKADEKSIARRRNGHLQYIVRDILETESPLSEDWLLRRLLFLFRRTKVTAAVKQEYDARMLRCERYGIIRKNGYLYSDGKPLPVMRVPAEYDEPREIKYIAPEELASGLYILLRQNISADKAGLFRLAANQLGFTRVGEAADARMEQAIALLKDRINVDGDKLTLK